MAGPSKNVSQKRVMLLEPNDPVAWKDGDEAMSVSQRIVQIRKDGGSGRLLYVAGMAQGRQVLSRDLGDVLYAVRLSGLGKPTIVEESNNHVLFRMYDCICFRSNNKDDCLFVAGYLAGAMLATGRFEDLTMEEVSCGEPPSKACKF